jgi:PAS domain S-box-containing protein
MMRNFKITTKLTLVFVLFAAVLLLALSVPAYLYSRNVLLDAALTERISTSLEKQTALRVWVEDHKQQLSIAANARHIQTDLAMFIRTQSSSNQAQALHETLRKDLVEWSGPERQLLSLMLIDAQSGQVLVSTRAGDEGKDVQDQAYYIQGRQALYVENPFLDPLDQIASMLISAPVYSTDGKTLLGVMVGRLNMASMTEIIQRRSGLNRSDDAFLINSAAILVTLPRFSENMPVLQSGFRTAAVDSCLAHNNGTLEALDYRGVPAIIVYHWLPDYQLCLIVKIDQEEAYADSRSLGGIMALTGIAILLLGSVIAWQVARSIARPILVLEHGAGQLGQGNLNYRIENESRDEVGSLGRAFNQMAADIASKEAQLHEWSVELEQRVQQRTQELHQSEDRYRMLSETSPDMIFVLDLQSRVQYVNTLGASMFGTTALEATGQPAAQLFPPDMLAELTAGLKNVIETGEPFAMQSELVTLTGARWLDTKWVALRDPQGQVNALMGVSRDVTEARQSAQALSQKALELQRSNSELERFAYVASHDLQEPLRMVSSYLQLLERRYKEKLDGDALEFIAYAVDGAARMKLLINDLLTYSRIGSCGKEFALTDCEKVLANVLKNLQVAIQETGAQITHTPLPAVMADGGQLEQLFQNLIGNALKFHGPHTPEIQVGAVLLDGVWRFSIADNGVGIEPQYFDRIFIIFQRLHTREEYDGTGIGLAVSKRIVERHGGQIWIESQPGQGTTFYFSIPAIGDKV